jgi:hypothetical protein
MRRRTRRAWSVAALASSLALGCQLGTSRPAYSDDPLVLSKHPVEGRPAQTAAPLLLARAEPALPLLPATALAQAPHDSQGAGAPETATTSPPGSDGPVSPPGPGLPIGPALRIKPLVRPEAVPTGRERPAPERSPF